MSELPEEPSHRRLHHVAPDGLTRETAQSAGMLRRAAISGATVGSKRQWMGQTRMSPATVSANHHHGDSETAIYVVSGRPSFVFLDVEGDEPREVRIDARPGDFVFVPPFVPHREENPDPEEEAVVVIARSSQEAIVVNLDSLSWDR
ncbi:cupin domain-containing protein [Sphaerisporangium corydalis]|uniref:Cupin domain-containing protein n=1 Tax=Sphaerisporangium corydalis TaxID=1441875 RepID=A0ABV9EQZ6_9ACTN|nr:cupin domain-containing protein [Sphaerisporangium corydalis]